MFAKRLLEKWPKSRRSSHGSIIELTCSRCSKPDPGLVSEFVGSSGEGFDESQSSFMVRRRATLVCCLAELLSMMERRASYKADSA